MFINRLCDDRAESLRQKSVTNLPEQAYHRLAPTNLNIYIRNSRAQSLSGTQIAFYEESGFLTGAIA